MPARRGPAPPACRSRRGRLDDAPSPNACALPACVTQSRRRVHGRTLSIIKPDATERNLTGAVNKMIEDAGLRIVAQKRIHMSRPQAEGFYEVHAERPFFGELVAFMTSGPVVVQVLEGENAVARYRDVMGATNPEQAADGTIRRAYARNIGENSVHGSDSAENAAREIAFFFTDGEIVG